MTMIPALPTLTGASWLVLLVKTLGAVGFIWTANLVILYAS
jgi:hypothetical protein